MDPSTDDNRTYDWPDAKVATVFVHAVESGRLNVPYPGSGQTRQRWAVLEGGQRRAMQVRALVEAAATEVLLRVGRALGAGPLGHDEVHARRVADLTVYLRQHHAERDLAELGALVAAGGASW